MPVDGSTGACANAPDTAKRNADAIADDVISERRYLGCRSTKDLVDILLEQTFLVRSTARNDAAEFAYSEAGVYREVDVYRNTDFMASKMVFGSRESPSRGRYALR